MITTQLSPTAGKIKINGIDVLKNPIEARKRIGIVAQHNNLDRGLTAYENLLYHGRYFGMDMNESKERAIQLLTDFGLDKWKNDYVRSFSGGMAQRLKIARAIMHRPELLFLDEPTTGLDPAYRDILWKHVLELNKKNQTTVFLTTHYMEEPEKFSDRIAIYNRGNIKAVGTLEELRSLVPSKNIIYLQLDMVPKEETTILEKIPGVSKVVFKSNQELIIYADGDEQILSKIIREIDKQSLLLTSIKLSATTLDDIFIHLTTDQGEA